MVDKFHYQAAAKEVAGGYIDQALWTKVNADMPGATKVHHQAKYIQLRAREMDFATKASVVSRFIPNTWWQWILFVGADLLVASIISSMGDGNGIVIIFAMLVFIFLLASAIILKFKQSSTYQSPSTVDETVDSVRPPATPFLTDNDISETNQQSPPPNQDSTNNTINNDDPASGDYFGFLWLLCILSIFVTSYIAVVIAFSIENIHNDSIGFFCGRWFGYFLIICALPFLTSIITRFRKPGLYLGLVISSSIILIALATAGQVDTQGISQNQSIHTEARGITDTENTYRNAAAQGYTRPNVNNTMVADTPVNRKKLCDSLKSNLAALQSNGPVVMIQNGKTLNLDEVQRKQQADTEQTQFLQYCQAQ